MVYFTHDSYEDVLISVYCQFLTLLTFLNLVLPERFIVIYRITSSKN